MQPFSCVFIADANSEIQGKRAQLTVSCFNPVELDKVLVLTQHSLQRSGFSGPSQSLGEFSNSTRRAQGGQSW